MTSDRASTIGQQVSRYRKAAKMSAEDLAEKAGNGLTRSVIANLENGRKDDVTVKQLMALSYALHVPPALLIGDVFDPTADSPHRLPGGYTKMGHMIYWVGAHSFFAAVSSDGPPATKLAHDGWTAVSHYIRSYATFEDSLRSYAELKDDTHSVVQAEARRRAGYTFHSAENALLAVELMQSAGVTVPGNLRLRIYESLESVGLDLDAAQAPREYFDDSELFDG